MDRIINEELRRRSGQYRLKDAIWNQRLQWFAHLKRMQAQQMPKQANELKDTNEEAEGHRRFE